MPADAPSRPGAQIQGWGGGGAQRPPPRWVGAWHAARPGASTNRLHAAGAPGAGAEQLPAVRRGVGGGGSRYDLNPAALPPGGRGGGPSRPARPAAQQTSCVRACSSPAAHVESKPPRPGACGRCKCQASLSHQGVSQFKRHEASAVAGGPHAGARAQQSRSSAAARGPPSQRAGRGAGPPPPCPALPPHGTPVQVISITNAVQSAAAMQQGTGGTSAAPACCSLVLVPPPTLSLSASAGRGGPWRGGRRAPGWGGGVPRTSSTAPAHPTHSS